MATTAVGGDICTLADLAKLTGDDQRILRVTEYMTKKSPFLQDVHWQQGNLTTGHRVAYRTALPTVHWRAMNEGVDRSKSVEDTVDETCGLLEGRSEVDVKLIELNGGEAFRLKKDMAFTQAFANELEDSFFHSSTDTTPKQIHGLAPRLDDLTTSSYAEQVVESVVVGTGDCFDVWIIGWGEDKVYGIVPKGTQAGLSAEDMGTQLVDDANSNKYRAKVTVWNQWAGLCVEDYRYVVRVCNNDTSDIIRTGSLLIQSMVDGLHQIYDLRSCNPIIYMPRLAYRYLHHQAMQGTFAGTLTMESIQGSGMGPLMKFMGVPVHMSDALLTTNTELA